MAVTPTGLVYQIQLVGTDSVLQTVTLLNSDSAPITLTGITATGDFTESDTCISPGMTSAVLAPRAQCIANVTFHPAAAGNLSGQLTVTDLNWTSPQAVHLSGVGSGLIVGGFVSSETAAIGRVSHSATVLNNGMLLLAGGSVTSTAAELYDGATGMFTPAGEMETLRMSQSANLLPDGKVLIAGGTTAPQAAVDALSSAEIYDPGTNSFTPAGNMTAARMVHTATLLTNGKVLITGGSGPQSVMASAEIYDPVTGAFTSAGNMTTPRYLHTATLLNDGTVLLAGGCFPECVFDAEIYDPQTGEFSGLANMVYPTRVGHRATLLSDGTVLITGGSSGLTGTAEIYNPVSKLFTATAGEMVNGPLSTHAATLLNNGRVLLTGTLSDPSVDITNGAQTYDPQSGLFTASPNMEQARSSHTATALNNGNVLVIGGDPIGVPIYDPYTETWASPAYSPSAEIYQTPPVVPAITSLSPASGTAGGAAQTLTINGTNFGTTSTVTYDGVAHTATVVSPTQLTIVLSASDQATAGTFAVVVTNPAPGGGASSPVGFSVENLSPGITSLSPISVTLGAPAQTLTVNGANFVPTSTVTYNETLHTPTFVSSTQLTITLSTSDQATDGTFAVVVANPAPGGGESSPANLTVSGPVVSWSASSLTFAGRQVGTTSAAQTLTLTNTGNASLAISAISTNADFPQTSPCVTTLNAGDHCTISVTFAPQAGEAEPPTSAFLTMLPAPRKSSPSAGWGRTSQSPRPGVRLPQLPLRPGNRPLSTSAWVVKGACRPR